MTFLTIVKLRVGLVLSIKPNPIAYRIFDDCEVTPALNLNLSFRSYECCAVCSGFLHISFKIAGYKINQHTSVGWSEAVKRRSRGDRTDALTILRETCHFLVTELGYCELFPKQSLVEPKLKTEMRQNCH